MSTATAIVSIASMIRVVFRSTMKSWPQFEIREPKPDIGPEPVCMGDGPFRRNVAALILRRSKQADNLDILLGERTDTPNAWQWPQGGLDEGETVEACLRRELWEELAVRRFDILGHFPFLLQYRFPQRLAERFAPRVGQCQLYYAVSLAPGETPNLELAPDKEFATLQWVPLEKADARPKWFKAGVYREAKAHLLSALASGQISMPP